jgi:hypothetical protein
VENPTPPVPPIAPGTSAPPASAPAGPAAPAAPKSPAQQPTAPKPTATAGVAPWPAVPPAPAPVKPTPTSLPDPPVLHSTPIFPAASAAFPVTPAAPFIPRVASSGDDSPTIPVAAAGQRRGEAIAAGRSDPDRSADAEPSTRRPAPSAPVSPPVASAEVPEESPLIQLQRTVRRQQALARNPARDLVWQPRFAYSTALVILLALTVVSMPLWIVLYRITGSTANNGGPPVADLVALCMMLLGGFLAGAAAWVIIIEMRGRVRMVDTLAKSGERELIAPAAPELPVLDAPLDALTVEPMAGRSPGRPAPGEAGWDPAAAAASYHARAEAQQVSAAATLEASGKLLSAFSSVLKAFGQLPAQVAMLAVSLALFVGATVLSLH